MPAGGLILNHAQPPGNITKGIGVPSRVVVVVIVLDKLSYSEILVGSNVAVIVEP